MRRLLARLRVVNSTGTPKSGRVRDPGATLRSRDSDVTIRSLLNITGTRLGVLGAEARVGLFGGAVGDNGCIAGRPPVYAASRRKSADGSSKNINPQGPPAQHASRRTAAGPSPAVPHCTFPTLVELPGETSPSRGCDAAVTRRTDVSKLSFCESWGMCRLQPELSRRDRQFRFV